MQMIVISNCMTFRICSTKPIHGDRAIIFEIARSQLLNMCGSDCLGVVKVLTDD